MFVSSNNDFSVFLGYAAVSGPAAFLMLMLLHKSTGIDMCVVLNTSHNIVDIDHCKKWYELPEKQVWLVRRKLSRCQRT